MIGKNSFDGLISRLDAEEKRIIELKIRSIDIFQTEAQREKKKDYKSRTSKSCRTISNKKNKRTRIAKIILKKES